MGDKDQLAAKWNAFVSAANLSVLHPLDQGRLDDFIIEADRSERGDEAKGLAYDWSDSATVSDEMGSYIVGRVESGLALLARFRATQI